MSDKPKEMCVFFDLDGRVPICIIGHNAPDYCENCPDKVLVIDKKIEGEQQ